MDNILEVKALKTYIYTARTVVKAVNDISFDIHRGEVFGLVGESGSGKTLTALSILRLILPPGNIVNGNIIFNGTDIMCVDERMLGKIRGSKISIVFQEPSSAFNPVLTIGYQIRESIIVHQRLGATQAGALAMDFLGKVHIKEPKRIYHSYPHQLSGGMKQRAMIAMALANCPELLILDEPTTALDVTIQAQILELLEEIIDRDKMSALFISHDLDVIAKMCDRVGVMHRGCIVEMGSVSTILNKPQHAYTVELVESARELGRQKLIAEC